MKDAKLGLVSIVIVTYESSPWIEACLDSIRQQSYRSLETIIVDNASTDGTVAVIGAHGLDTILDRSAGNLGFAAGANRGARQATGEYLLFLNPDTRLDPDCLERLVATAEEHGGNAIISPLQRTYDGRDVLTSGSAVDIFGYPVGDIPRHVFYADGAALFISGAAFEQIGGFDERLFMFHEDIDLCWRGHLQNIAVLRCPEAIVYHVSGASAEGGAAKGGRYRTTEFRRFHGEKNILRNIIKNVSPATLVWLIPAYLFFLGAEIALMLAIGQKPAARADVAALRWNIRELRDTLAARRAIQQTRRVSDGAVRRNMVKNSYKIMHVFRHGIPRVS